MSIEIGLLAAEMQRYVVQNRNVVKADFARATKVEIDSYCKKVTKIKGRYQTLHSLMTHVVQGFAPEWKELGTLIVKDKEHASYRQKINFGFVPAEVLGTFLADWYDEKEKPTNKTIAKKILEWIMTQATDDLALLSILGERNDAFAHGHFGFSLDGWNTIIKGILGNTVNPCYKIPSATINENNVIDVIRNFERKLPKLLKTKIKEIHLSTNILEMYETAYFNEYGAYPSFRDSDKTRSPLRKRTLVGWDDMDDDVVFATVDGNMLNLVDEIENPGTVTDIQVQDYKVKVFGEFEKGYSLLINQMTVVADFTNNVEGLGDDQQMKIYYPHQQKPEVPVIDIEDVIVDPETASVEQGQTQAFIASVEPPTAPQDVVWSIATADGLAISENGLVTTTAATPAGDYEVTATSLADGTVKGTATLTVTEA